MSRFVEIRYNPPEGLAPGQTSIDVGNRLLAQKVTHPMMEISATSAQPHKITPIPSGLPATMNPYPIPADRARVSFVTDIRTPEEGTLIVRPDARNPQNTQIIRIDAQSNIQEEMPHSPESRYLMQGQVGERIDVVYGDPTSLRRQLLATIIRTADPQP